MTQHGLSPEDTGRFEDLASKDVRYFAPGIALRPARGANMSMIHVTFEPNAEAPMHSHPEEQMVLVLDGGMRFTLAGVTKDLTPGDIVIIPSSVPHGATAGPGGCVEVEFFHPPRPS